MKKRWLVFIGICLLLCACGKSNKEDVIKQFKNKVSTLKSYKINGNMEISNDEEKFVYSLESYYLKGDYYKVILVNQTNNHEQIILKNKENIYVITPALNKSFKFQSEWPNNSSQAYLLDSLVNDLEKDPNSEVSETDTGFIIKTKVNYPNNEELIYQKIYLNNDLMVENVEVYNNNDLIKIKVSFDNVDLNNNLSENDFKLENYVKEETNQKEECTDEKCEDKQTDTKKSASIENVIYPLYIPSNTFLSSSEKVQGNNGNRVILTFSGEKNFVLIEEALKSYDDLEIIPVYGEPLMLSESIGALSANSLSWDVQNVSYYLASTDLSVKEMQSIANSLGNSALVANTK